MHWNGIALASLWTAIVILPGHCVLVTTWGSCGNSLINVHDLLVNRLRGLTVTYYMHRSTLVFYKGILSFGGHKSFLWSQCFETLFWTSGDISSGFASHSRQPYCLVEAYVSHINLDSLWCDTCWPLGDQHSSWAILFQVPVSRHWWGLKLGSVMSQTNALPIELWWRG